MRDDRLDTTMELPAVPENRPKKKVKLNKKRLAMTIVIIVFATTILSAAAYGVYFMSQSPEGKLQMVGDVATTLNLGKVPEKTNVLIAGVDEEGYRTDTMMVVNFDTTAKKVNILQIPRDTYVEGNDRWDKKINSAYYTSIEQLDKEIEMVTGITVDKYAVLDVNGFRELIDLIGGVDMDVPMDMDYDDPVQNLAIHIEAGLQTLDGKQAEGFVRFRQNNDGTGYVMGDIDRIHAQRSFLDAVMKKATSMSTVWKIPDMVQVIMQNLKTDLTNQEIIGYATEILKIKSEDIVFHNMPGDSEYIDEVSYFLTDEGTMEDIAVNYFYATGGPTVTRRPDAEKYTDLPVSTGEIAAAAAEYQDQSAPQQTPRGETTYPQTDYEDEYYDDGYGDYYDDEEYYEPQGQLGDQGGYDGEYTDPSLHRGNDYYDSNDDYDETE